MMSETNFRNYRNLTVISLIIIIMGKLWILRDSLPLAFLCHFIQPYRWKKNVIISGIVV